MGRKNSSIEVTYILLLRNRAKISATSGFASVSRDRICVNFLFKNSLTIFWHFLRLGSCTIFKDLRSSLSVSQPFRWVWTPLPTPGSGLRLRRGSSSRLTLCVDVAASSSGPALELPLETRCFLPQQCTCRLRGVLATFGDETLKDYLV